jgi:hypothetical protein
MDDSLLATFAELYKNYAKFAPKVDENRALPLLNHPRKRVAG